MEHPIRTTIVNNTAKEFASCRMSHEVCFIYLNFAGGHKKDIGWTLRDYNGGVDGVISGLRFKAEGKTGKTLDWTIEPVKCLDFLNKHYIKS